MRQMILMIGSSRTILDPVRSSKPICGSFAQTLARSTSTNLCLRVWACKTAYSLSLPDPKLNLAVGGGPVIRTGHGCRKESDLSWRECLRCVFLHILGWKRTRLTKPQRLVPPDSGRDTIIGQLRNAQFIRVERIITRWDVTHRDSRTSSVDAKAGRAAYSVQNGKLQLYMVAPHPTVGHYFDETAVALAKFCGIKDSECIIQLHSALRLPDRKFTEENLKAQGFAVDPASLEDGPDIGEWAY